MTVRVVLAVVFALALLAAAQPAVEHARTTRDAAELDASTDRVADAVDALVRRSDPGPTLATAPRRSLVLDLPDAAELRVRGDPPRVAATLNGGPAHTRPLPAPVVVCGGRSTLDGRVTLAYVGTGDGPVVLVVRGFIRESGTNHPHACAHRPPPASRRPGVRV